jgi:hypothetical protein
LPQQQHQQQEQMQQQKQKQQHEMARFQDQLGGAVQVDP